MPPSLSDLYNFPDNTNPCVPGVSGIYIKTNTPWLAKHSRDNHIDFNNESYNQHVVVAYGPPKNPILATWPIKFFCQNSAFFSSIFAPPTPITPNSTPNYIHTLRRQYLRTSRITFPYTTPSECAAFSIFIAWNLHGSLQYASEFICITSDDVERRLEQYVKMWDQLLECYKLSQYLEAPKFANKIIDTMALAIREESSHQSKRRKMEDQREDPGDINERSGEYRDLIHNLQNLGMGGGNQVGNSSTFSGVDAIGQKLPTSPPDPRHILGATPKQITKLYFDTAPKSPLRRLLIDKIIAYSMRYPKYYGQNGGFGDLLGASGPGDEEFCVPMEFVRELLSAFARAEKEKAKGLEMSDGCVYHDHRDGGDFECPGMMGRRGGVSAGAGASAIVIGDDSAFVVVNEVGETNDEADAIADIANATAVAGNAFWDVV